MVKRVTSVTGSVTRPHLRNVDNGPRDRLFGKFCRSSISKLTSSSQKLKLIKARKDEAVHVCNLMQEEVEAAMKASVDCFFVKSPDVEQRRCSYGAGSSSSKSPPSAELLHARSSRCPWTPSPSKGKGKAKVSGDGSSGSRKIYIEDE